MTAAEAAEAAARDVRGGGGGDGAAAAPAEDVSPCAADADCTLTRYPVGSCCPALCMPRAVTREAEARFEQKNAACRCAMPMCRPPPREVTAACVNNRCVEKNAGPSY